MENSLVLIPGKLYKTTSELTFYVRKQDCATYVDIPENSVIMFLKDSLCEEKKTFGYCKQYFLYENQITFVKRYDGEIYFLPDYLELLI